jgi:peptide/nickel transport system permease protein
MLRFLQFLGRRLLYAVATLWVLSLIVFVMGALAPGGPVEAKLGQHASQEAVDRLKHQYGLDQPLPEQYVRWLGGVLRGNFGESFRDDQPVGKILLERYPITVRLGLMAAVIAVLFGVPLGLAAAVRSGTWIDRFATTLSLVGVSAPAFVILPLLVLLFSLRLRWFPVTYDREWWHLLLPALALGARPAALVARMTRASFLEALGEDYVRTARAKGLSWPATVLRHAGKNSVLPILTVLGTSVGYMLGGSFVVESIFSVPGIGEISVMSIPARDYPMIQAVTLLGAAVFIFVNLAVDLLYGLFDPRLRVAAQNA